MCRLDAGIAKDIQMSNAPELFAATPPIEPLKCFLRSAARCRSQYIMHIDMSRACFYSDVVRDIYKQLPPVDQTEKELHLCGKLVQVIDAVESWRIKFSDMARGRSASWRGTSRRVTYTTSTGAHAD